MKKAFLFTSLIWVLFFISTQGCAPTAEQEDIYGEVIGETVEGVEDTQLITLSEENQKLKEQVSQLESEKSRLLSDKSELERKLISLQESNQQLTAKVSELATLLEAERQKTRELSAKISSYELMPQSETELRAEIAKRDSEIAEYRQQIRDLQAKIAELEVKVSAQPTPPEIVKEELKPTIYPGISLDVPKIEMTEKEFRNYYNRGLNNFKNRRYKTAIAYFDTLLRSTVDSNLKINAVYWIGESYFALKQYEKAIEYFDYVVQTKSHKTPDALYMLGRCYAALGKIKEAKEYMNRVLKEYPQSPVAKKAKSRLERL